MKLSKVSFILAVLFLITNLCWICWMIDAAISFSYNKTEFEYCTKDRHALLKIINPLLSGKNMSDIQAIANMSNPTGTIFKKAGGGPNGEDQLVLEGVVFTFDSQGKFLNAASHE